MRNATSKNLPCVCEVCGIIYIAFEFNCLLFVKVIVCNFTDYNFGQVSCLPYWMPRVLLSGSQFWHSQQYNRVIKPRGLLYNSCSSFLYWNRLWYRYLLRFRISWLKILFWTLAFILLKTGRHCLQLAWVVQPASEILDFYGAFYCRTGFYYMGHLGHQKNSKH